MHPFRILSLLFSFCICMLTDLYAQDQVPIGHGGFTIRNIILEGNQKTRKKIILRELPFQVGDQLEPGNLNSALESGRKNLMNTALFYKAELTVINQEDGYADVRIFLIERCYLLPKPYFEIIDRSFHEWITEQHADLSRVNVGLRIVHNNASGLNDKLRFTIIRGFSRQFNLNYDRAYFDKGLHWGFSAGFSAGKNHEVNYNTINDRQVFWKDGDKYVRHFVNGGIQVTYRKAIKTKHHLGFQYAVEEIADTVTTMNPTYYKSGSNRARFATIYYSLNYSDLDYIPYPTSGVAAQLYFSKRGFNHDLNEWKLSLRTLVCLPMGPGWFLKFSGYGSIKLPFRQPYIHRQFLGHGDTFMQGYENYVVDGVAGGFLKTTLTKKLFGFDFKSPVKKHKDIYRIPVRVFGKIYGNTGYVYDPQQVQNDLANHLLYSGGIGIDILAAYSLTLRFEWSFNHLGQNGLFLQQKSIY